MAQETIVNEFFEYIGETVNGMPDGFGKIRYIGDDYFLGYEGYFKEGKENGKGRQVTVDGVCECEFVDGTPRGIGKFIYRGGDVYEGPIDGLPEGEGIVTLSDGRTFRGLFRGGYPEGEGILTDLDGTETRCEFPEDRMPAEYSDEDIV